MVGHGHVAADEDEAEESAVGPVEGLFGVRFSILVGGGFGVNSNWDPTMFPRKRFRMSSMPRLHSKVALRSDWHSSGSSEK